MLNYVGLSAIPWIATCKSPLSAGSSKQEYWSRLPFPFPGDLPDPGIKPRSLALQTDFFSHQATSVKALAAQSCLTLCDLMDCSLPGSSVLEFPKARILEWVAISFSMESS